MHFTYALNCVISSLQGKRKEQIAIVVYTMKKTKFWINFVSSLDFLVHWILL